MHYYNDVSSFLLLIKEVLQRVQSEYDTIQTEPINIHLLSLLLVFLFLVDAFSFSFFFFFFSRVQLRVRDSDQGRMGNKNKYQKT